MTRNTRSVFIASTFLLSLASPAVAKPRLLADQVPVGAWLATQNFTAASQPKVSKTGKSREMLLLAFSDGERLWEVESAPSVGRKDQSHYGLNSECRVELKSKSGRSFTLPEGSVLEVTRVAHRQLGSEYDGLSYLAEVQYALKRVTKLNIDGEEVEGRMNCWQGVVGRLTAQDLLFKSVQYQLGKNMKFHLSQPKKVPQPIVKKPDPLNSRFELP